MCGGGQARGRPFPPGRMTPARSSMANGCLRSLKVISENSLISIYEFENIAPRPIALPLKRQCRAMRCGRTDDELAHVLGRVRAKLLARKTQIAHRKTDRRQAHAA